MKENLEALAHYRFEQAGESSDSAQLLFDNGNMKAVNALQEFMKFSEQLTED